MATHDWWLEFEGVISTIKWFARLDPQIRYNIVDINLDPVAVYLVVFFFQNCVVETIVKYMI